MRTPIIELVNSGELDPIQALKMCIGWMGDHEEQAMLEWAGYKDESCEEKTEVTHCNAPDQGEDQPVEEVTQSINEE